MLIGSANDALYFFVPRMQSLVINDLILHSEEKQFFIDKVEELRATIRDMPEVFGQSGKGENAIAYLHYFGSYGDFWITEKDVIDPGDENPGEQLQPFGIYMCAGMERPKFGTISLSELIEMKYMEIDLHFTPKTVREIKAEYNKE